MMVVQEHTLLRLRVGNGSHIIFHLDFFRGHNTHIILFCGWGVQNLGGFVVVDVHGVFSLCFPGWQWCCGNRIDLEITPAWDMCHTVCL